MHRPRGQPLALICASLLLGTTVAVAGGMPGMGTRIDNTGMAIVLLLGTTVAVAGGMPGTVTQIDDTGRATVKTADGKEHTVKGEGWKVGAKVTCASKAGQIACRAAL
jgi:preprotein translocase subunit YajC